MYLIASSVQQVPKKDIETTVIFFVKKHGQFLDGVYGFFTVVSRVFIVVSRGFHAHAFFPVPTRYRWDMVHTIYLQIQDPDFAVSAQINR